MFDRFDWGDVSCRRLWRTDKVNVCSRSNCHVCCNARKFFARAGKCLPKAEKFAGKFDVFRLKHFMLATGRDVNASLQVKTRSMRDTSAFGPDLHKSDRVTLFDPLASIR